VYIKNLRSTKIRYLIQNEIEKKKIIMLISLVTSNKCVWLFI